MQQLVSTNGCSNLRNHNRRYHPLLSNCLLHHHRRHLQVTLLRQQCSQCPLNSSITLFNSMALSRKRVESALLLVGLVLFGSCLDLGTGHQHHAHSHSGSCASDSEAHHRHCGDAHDHDHHHHHAHHHDDNEKMVDARKLPEELAEEEDMKLYGFGLPHDHGHDHHDHGHHHYIGATELSGLGILFLSIFALAFFSIRIPLFLILLVLFCYKISSFILI